MKKKLVESIPPVFPEKGCRATIQAEKELLILNVFKEKTLRARHCINVETGEYMTLRDDRWHPRMIDDAIEQDIGVYGYYPGGWYSGEDTEKTMKLSEQDIQKAAEALRSDSIITTQDVYWEIRMREEQYGRDRREKTEFNRIRKVEALMDKMPDIPEDIREWIDQRELGGEDYALKDRETGKWSCSHCGNSFDKERLIPAGEGKIRDRDMLPCPECGKMIRYMARKRTIQVDTAFAMIQPIDQEISTVRHFDVRIACIGGRKRIRIDEAMRVIMRRDWNSGRLMGKAIPACEIYYNGTSRFATCARIPVNNQWFDNKSNRANRRAAMGYLYDGGIREAFKGTAYERWTRTFEQMAAGGAKANYNRLMVSDEDRMIDLTELLFKGRFKKLLAETSEGISYWNGAYCDGTLNLYGHTIEDVFDIEDRQKINRIRDRNGGRLMVRWMQWSDRHRTKISDKALMWLLENNLAPQDMQWINCRFTIEQAMNYIERQKRESYPGRSTKTVISQYEDYMRMCEKLHKDTTDAMVCKPRELKRRHDEAVKEIERRSAEIKAEEYSKKFGAAEAVLGEIREKYEYTGEEYFIMVPARIADIVAEGNHLHHCAGATDRYFDRIEQHETYICFLRKKEEPDTPFYTIEVEPGGTIRQHRGMYDEEPDIERVKPFLREWQKEIRKRMKQRDHELAAASAVKREENIRELREKNNTRVLQGLMEDFMEVAG